MSATKSLSVVTSQKPSRATPRLKSARKDARAEGRHNETVEAWDPRERDRGKYGMMPFRLIEFLNDKLYASPTAKQLFLFLGREIWGNLHKNDGIVQAYTTPLTYKVITDAIRGPEGKKVNEKTIRAIFTWAVENRCIALEKVGQSYKIALLPAAWTHAKAFDPTAYMPMKEEKPEEVQPPDEAKSEEEAKSNGSILPKDRVVLLPGKRHVITLVAAVKARETMFRGVRDDQPFRIECRSRAGTAISCAAELVPGAIRLHIGDGEQIAKQNGSILPKADFERLETWLRKYRAEGALDAVAERLQDAGVPVDFYTQVGETEVASMRVKQKLMAEGFFIWIVEVAAARWGKEATRLENVRKPNGRDVLPFEPDVAMLRHTLEHGNSHDRELAREALESIGVAV